MKKRIFGIAALALATVLASCSKENDLGYNANEGNSMLAFSFNKPQGSFVTYADIASAAEWNIAVIDVYAAVDGTVTKLATTDYTLAESAKTYTITMKNTWVAANAAKTANFYFVGNDATSTLGAHSDLAETAEADFRNALTNELQDAGSGKYDMIVKPNGSTQNLLFSTIIENVKVEGKVNKNAVLTRREARFDVENPLYAADAFKVTEILVSNASTSGLIFPCGDPTGVTINKKSHVAVPAIAAADYAAADMTAKSVFYLYPTEMGAGKTEIVVMGSMGGEAAKAYPVDASSVGNKIEANTRYILVLDPTTVTFKITVADYEDGGKLPAQLGGDDAFALTNFAASVPANWAEATQVYTFDATAGATLAFDAETKFGTDFEVVYAFGQQADLDVADITVTKNSNATYAGYEVVDSYTINVPASTNDGFGIRVIIKSVGGAGQQTILFQKGTVEVEDLFVDPKITEKVKEVIGHDDITAGDLSDITTLDVSNQEITSLEGIGKNLPNLTEINVSGNTNLTEVDLSENPKLTKVNLANTNITQVDFSNNLLIDTLMLSGSKVTSVDVSMLTNLTYFTVNACPISAIDVSKNLKLETLGVKETVLRVLDVSKNTRLKVCAFDKVTIIDELIFPERLDNLANLVFNNATLPQENFVVPPAPNAVWIAVDESNIKKIDVTQCDKSKLRLDAKNMGHTLTVTVWSDFIIGNPASNFRGLYTAGSTISWDIKQ